jgi:hypothetical protein
VLVNYLIVINESNKEIVYPRPTSSSIQMVSHDLFFDLERKTISTTPYPGGLPHEKDSERTRFDNLPSLRRENHDLVPVGLHGGYLIFLDEGAGVLTRVIPEGYHWFPVSRCFPRIKAR